VQGWSESRWLDIAHRRGWREAQLARGGIREHDAFFVHEMRGSAGTGRGGASMAGGREGQGARKGNGVRGHRLPSPPWFAQNLLKYLSSRSCLYLLNIYHFTYTFSHAHIEARIHKHTCIISTQEEWRQPGTGAWSGEAEEGGL